MNDKQKAKVIEMVKSGHKVRMYSGNYMAGFANLHQNGEEWIISNNVLAPRRLEDVDFYDLTFYKQILVEA